MSCISTTSGLFLKHIREMTCKIEDEWGHYSRVSILSDEKDELTVIHSEPMNKVYPAIHILFLKFEPWNFKGFHARNV